MSGDDLALLLIWVAIFQAAWLVKLKWTNRRLRKSLAALETKPLATPIEAIHPTAVPDKTRDAELERLRERVAVLERITVEKEHSLAREIDALRG